MRGLRIISVIVIWLAPSLAAADALLPMPPVERVVARDIRPGLHLDDFRLMHWAAVRDEPKVLERLLDRGQDVDDRDVNGRTPLMVAAAFDSRRAAALLLSRGADPMARDEANGDTPLHFAALTGHADIARLLLGNGADALARAKHNGETPLHYAALYGHRGMIALLTGQGVPVDLPDIHGVRPLQYARLRQRSQAIELLLSLGARPDDLFDAVNAGDVARVQALLAAGADVNQAGLAGTPLHLAASVNQVGIAVMLIDAGADLEATGDPAGAHPLHLAAYGNLPEAAQLLIDRGADVDARDAEERSALLIAAAYGHAELAAILLDGGADANLLSIGACGRPLHTAAKMANLPIARLLLSRGARIDEVGLGGTTALHCATRHDLDRSALVRLLVANGADAFRPDESGRSAMQQAITQGSRGLIAALRGEPEPR